MARLAQRITGALLLAGVSIATQACSSSPEPTLISSFTPVALPEGVLGVQRATLAMPLVPRTGAGPDGPEMLTDPDGHLLALDAGRQVVLLGDPRQGPGGPWVRVWVVPSLEVWPGDFLAWLPTTRNGSDTLQAIAPAVCPAVATIETLAPLVQQDRLRCAGSTSLTFDARTGTLPYAAVYDVDPAWYGRNADPGVTLFDPGPARFGPDAKTTPAAAGAWIEARVPPDVPPLPVGLYLRVTGQFDDATASTCRRRIPNAVPGLGPPEEQAVDSVEWCREQFVVKGWVAVLGPEGRPIDFAAPQLHRHEFRAQPGVVIGCGGVGMPPLTVRIDPGQVDPVWIEWDGGRRSVAVFGPEFQLLLDPPRVQSTTGVTLRDREIVDPDRGKPGLAVCPGGETITFDVEQRAP